MVFEWKSRRRSAEHRAASRNVSFFLARLLACCPSFFFSRNAPLNDGSSRDKVKARAGNWVGSRSSRDGSIRQVLRLVPSQSPTICMTRADASLPVYVPKQTHTNRRKERKKETERVGDSRLFRATPPKKSLRPELKYRLLSEMSRHSDAESVNRCRLSFAEVAAGKREKKKLRKGKKQGCGRRRRRR